MLTYNLEKKPGVPLYEALYRCIRADILSGKLAPGQKLPSKRALAQNLEVSKITVEGAYEQLLCEGYIRSREKVGYFVEAVAQAKRPVPEVAAPEQARQFPLDLTANSCPDFPFTVWSSLQRQVMLDLSRRLLRELPNCGLWELRRAIAQHLAGFRGMQVDPENILIGAGTDFLYNLLIQLLGRDKVYAVEEPGYGKIRKIYAAGGVACVSAGMDSFGVSVESLDGAQVLHISPSHHFPSGLVTPLHRRRQLIDWALAGEDRYIIEDDYDSEFRFDAHPMPTMASLDTGGRVIYMNTFSKTLASSIRISYMVLPPALMAEFQRRLGFYSCTVPSFEQYTLARFLEGGYFEKHINRMRRAYQQRRNALVTMLRQSGLPLKILEQDAGLHFLVQVDTDLSDAQLEQLLARQGVKVAALGSYYHGDAPRNTHCLVVNYSGLTEENLQKLGTLLKEWTTDNGNADPSAPLRCAQDDRGETIPGGEM